MSDPKIAALPDEIRDSLKALESSIELTGESSKGANGYLFFGRNKILNRKVAIKFYYWGGTEDRHLEPSALAEVKSTNVIDILHADVVGTEYALFVTPFCENGDLDDLIAKHAPGLLRGVDIAIGVLNGLSALHSNQLIHRDLKPPNILVGNGGKPLIGDFGSVKRVADQNGTTGGSGHSLLYRPPESVETNQYGRTGDIYQMGILVYQLLGGYLPYEELAWLGTKQRKLYDATQDPWDKSRIADDELKRRILAGTVIQPNMMWPWVPKAVASVVRKACNKDPKVRYASTSHMLSALAALRPELPDWEAIDGTHVLRRKGIEYRVLPSAEDTWFVEKRRGTQWRRDHGFLKGALRDQIIAIGKT